MYHHVRFEGMGIVVGIDIGGSTTKIVGFRDKEMLIPAQIEANSAIASLFGAFGKFLYDNNLDIQAINQVNLTGVGSSQVDHPIYGLPTYKVDEFSADGLGGGYFAADKSEFMVISMGTGTTYVGVKNGVPVHMGGIGIGGGTIIGLSKYILATNDIDRIEEMAQEGDVGRIDLRIRDISKDPLPGLDLDITASNFAKASSKASLDDKAAGIVHMVIESILQTGALIAQNTTITDFVLIGALTNLPQCRSIAGMVKSLFPKYNFIIPEYGEYGTAIGTALAGKNCLKEVR